MRRLVMLGTALVSMAPAAHAQSVESSVVDGWHQTRFDASCNATRSGAMHMLLDVKRKAGSTVTMTIIGLPAPRTVEELMASDEAAIYDTQVSVTVGGTTAFVAKTTRANPAVLELRDLPFERLQPLSAPGKINFAFKGPTGKDHSVTYESAGLATAIAFLSECRGN